MESKAPVDSGVFEIKEVNSQDQTIMKSEENYYVKYNTATIDMSTPENDGEDVAPYTL